jgi:hypothetical protein
VQDIHKTNATKNGIRQSINTLSSSQRTHTHQHHLTVRRTPASFMFDPGAIQAATQRPRYYSQGRPARTRSPLPFDLSASRAAPWRADWRKVTHIRR